MTGKNQAIFDLAELFCTLTNNTTDVHIVLASLSDAAVQRQCAQAVSDAIDLLSEGWTRCVALGDKVDIAENRALTLQKTFNEPGIAELMASLDSLRDIYFEVQQALQHLHQSRARLKATCRTLGIGLPVEGGAGAAFPQPSI